MLELLITLSVVVSFGLMAWSWGLVLRWVVAVYLQYGRTTCLIDTSQSRFESREKGARFWSADDPASHRVKSNYYRQFTDIKENIDL